MDKAQIRDAYKALKVVVTEDRHTNAARGQVEPADGAPRGPYPDSDLIWEKAQVLMSLLRTHAEEIEGSSDPLFTKAKAFLLDALDIAGRLPSEWADELIEQERSLLNEVPRLIEKNTEESVELALAKLWLSLRVAEEYYRRSEYKEASNSVERLWGEIVKHVGESREMLSLLMTGLTEESPLTRKIHQIRTEQYHEGGQAGRLEAGGGAARANVWKRCAEDLLALLGRLGLTEGKIYIRRAHFSDADKSLEQCMRSISAWCALKLGRLAERDGAYGGRRAVTPEAREATAVEVRRTENFALYGTALAQSYLAFSYYRRGQFRRALTQVIPAGLILRRSHWTFSNVFADLILAGAGRRLAGIHNEEHVKEAIVLCENTIELFDPEFLISKAVYAPRNERAGGLNVAFLLRACYEIGASYYYLAEMSENYLPKLRKDESPDARRQERLIKKDMRDYLDKTSRYASIIISCIKKTKPREAAFWLANARHLEALEIMKRIVCDEQPDSSQAEEVFQNAERRIKAAMESARQDISKWQQTEILTDQAYILNASARSFDERVHMLREKRARLAEESVRPSGRQRPKKGAPGGRVPEDKEHTSLLAQERDLTKKKRALAEQALERLDEAWAVASEMASDESGQYADRKSAQPRPNFAGPIYLYRADSYALLSLKEEAVTAYDDWERVRSEVEYSRVIDLSHSVRKRVEKIDQTLVFNRDGEDGLNAEKQVERLRKWLYDQAMSMASNKNEASTFLGVPRSTFYDSWNKVYGKPDEPTD